MSWEFQPPVVQMELNRALKHLEDARKAFLADQFNPTVEFADAAVEATVRTLLTHAGAQTTSSMSFFDMLETLERSGYAIPRRKTIVELRIKRNKIIHETYDADRADAKEALSVADFFIDEARKLIAPEPRLQKPHPPRETAAPFEFVPVISQAEAELSDDIIYEIEPVVVEREWFGRLKVVPWEEIPDERLKSIPSGLQKWRLKFTVPRTVDKRGFTSIARHVVEISPLFGSREEAEKAKLEICKLLYRREVRDVLKKVKGKKKWDVVELAELFASSRDRRREEEAKESLAEIHRLAARARRKKPTERIAERNEIIAKVVVPPACLAAACGVFFLFLKLSPYNAPLALAVFLTAVACAYDLKYLKIPWWIPGALIGGGVAYYISLCAGLLPVPPELESLVVHGLPSVGGTYSILLLWLLGLTFSAFVAYFAFVLIGVGQQDFAMMVGIGALVPARIVPNLASMGSVIYIPSVVLNTATVGVLVALFLYIAYRSFRSTSPAKTKPEPTHFEPAELGSPRRSVVWEVIGILCVAAFWIGVRFALLSLLGPTPKWEPLFPGVAWTLIGISCFFLFLYVPFSVWLANAFAVLLFVPTFLPVPFGAGNWTRHLLLLLLAFMSVLVFSAVKEFTMNRIPWLKGQGIPFVPAILAGLLLTTFWGDFVFGWVYPNILPLWQIV